MFDLERYIENSTEKSGVPLKVSDKDTLLSVASQLKRTTTEEVREAS